MPLAILRIKLTGVRDPDAFWHIRAGLHVWATHQLSGPDPFGTFTSRTWVQHEWLSEVAMAGAYSAFGLAGVAWLYVVADVLVYFAIYRLCRLWSGPLVAGVVGVLAWLGTSASLVQRPQVVSFILLAVTARVWLKWGAGDRTPWWLVALTWLWACSHGLWLTGPITGAALIAGLWLDGAVGKRDAARLMAVPLLSVVAAGLTPIGPRLLLTPFTVNSYAGLVTEWAPPDVHQPFVAATVGLLVATAVGWFSQVRRVSWVRILLWLMAFGWTLLYARTVALGAVLVAPLAAEQLQRLLRRPPEAATRGEWRSIATSAVASAALAAALASGQAGTALAMPTDLTAQLDALPKGTVVLNDDSAGGWLLLNYPDLRWVIDTRTEIYDPEYLSAYITARGTGPGWSAFVSRVDASVALLRVDTPLVVALTDVEHWRIAAGGGEWVLLSRR